MNIDKFLTREHSAKGYNCLGFAAEVWEELTGDQRLSLIKFGQPYRHDFKKLNAPEDPCIVIGHSAGPHIGILIGGSVLHCANKVTICESIHDFTDHFKKVEFYK